MYKSLFLNYLKLFKYLYIVNSILYMYDKLDVYKEYILYFVQINNFI